MRSALARLAALTLLAPLAFVVESSVLPDAAHAVSCYGADCDNVGPKGAGCFADDKILGEGGGHAIQLRYSDACHAMWAYGPYAPNFWDVELQLEMQKKNDAGNWVFAKRLTVVFEANGPADWTNALGARTKNFRFRAIYYDKLGYTTWSTPWGLGGDR